MKYYIPRFSISHNHLSLQKYIFAGLLIFYVSFFCIAKPIFAELINYKLNGSLVAGGDVVHPLSGYNTWVWVEVFKLTPNGERIVYLADQDIDEVYELYSVPIGGGTVTKLNPSLVSGHDIYDFIISPDSSMVVYLADQDTDGVQELYSVPISGGSATKLNSPMVTGGTVYSFHEPSFQISPDSSRVVYLADQDIDEVHELYSVPIGGGIVTELNSPLTELGDVFFSFKISPDSSRVVYTASRDTDDYEEHITSPLWELYSVPIGGGTITKLNSPLVNSRDVDNFIIDPDSNKVVYLADQDTNEMHELYSVPIDGGTITKLNSPLITFADIETFLISPDSSKVVYLADQDIDEMYELYSVPIGGGTVTKLNSPLLAGGTIYSYFHSTFLISPDSSRVVYLVDQVTDEVQELYSVPINGGTATKLSNPLVPSNTISSDFAISPDSSRVVYRVQPDTGWGYLRELFSVPLGGGTITMLNPPLDYDESVTSFRISPDSNRVVYTADDDTESKTELYSTPTRGGTVTKLNSPLVELGDVYDFLISPDSSRVVYRADQEKWYVMELYGVQGDSYNKANLLLFLPAIIGTKLADDILCTKIAGNWYGSWSETSCSGYSYSGSWTGQVTKDCRFNGTDNWDFVSGTINPSTMIFTGSGTSKDGCGTVTMRGIFSNNNSVSGNYTYSVSGGGTFSGRRIDQ